MFDPSDLVAPNDSPEAEAIFQKGRAHDISVIVDQPDSIPVELRGLEPDRKIARRYYAEAAEMGHVGAMNNLAHYEQNGWGHGNDHFPRNYKEAFRLNLEMARRGSATGFTVIGGYLIYGVAGVRDPVKGEACLVEAAARGDVNATLALAEYDLKLAMPEEIMDIPDPRRVERGLTLLEDQWLRGESEAYVILSSYSDSKAEDRLKSEFYAQEAMIAGNVGGYVRLSAIYNPMHDTRPDAAHYACLQQLKPAQYGDTENLCPRPGGPLTRAGAGLSPAPEQPLDVRAYLADFRARYPDL